AASLPGLPALPPPPVQGRPLDATTDWFLESTGAVPALDEADIGTQGVHAQKKGGGGFLIGVAVACVLGGVFLGGFLVFDGEGNKAAATPATPSLQSEAKAAEDKATQELQGVGGRNQAADEAKAP